MFVHDLMRAHEVALLQPLLDAVKDRNAVRLIGPSDATRRAPTVALSLVREAGDIAADLAKDGIMAGGGDFYAGRPLSAMGVDPALGVLRLSFTHYTTRAEIDQLLNALDRVL
jgi:selenocysteine lyase/cysteine desulfurase